MSISKLYAGIEGDPLNSTGDQIRDTVNQLIESHTNSLKNLPTAVNAQTDTVYNVIGFYTNTQIGGGKFVWSPSVSKTLHNGVTHYAPEAIAAWNGTVGALGTLLNWVGTGTGVWVRLLDISVTAEMIGAICDGVIDNTVVIPSIIAYCTQYSNPVHIAGVFLSGSITIQSSEKLIIKGVSTSARIKLKSGSNTHVIDTAGSAVIDLENIIIDQNASSQSSGHGIRSGGSSIFRLKKVTVFDTKGYGVGLQAGTNTLIDIDDLTIDGCDLDGFDLKDRNYNNGICRIGLIKVKNFNRSGSTTSAGVDIRGECNIDQLIVDISAGYGFRFRNDDGTQGRSGFGCVNNLTATGTGFAIQIESDSRNYVINNVVANCAGLLLHSASARGGTINNAVCMAGTATELISFFGSDITINNLSLKNTLSSSRLIDLEPGCDNIQINAFSFDDADASSEAVRAQTGATNINFSNGWIRGGTIGGAASGAVVTSNVRFL